MQRTDWRQSRFALPIFLVILGLIGGGVVGFSVDESDGWDSLTRLLPTFAVFLCLNFLIAWTGVWPEASVTKNAQPWPTALIAVSFGLVAATILVLRGQSWEFALTVGVITTMALASYVLLSSWLQVWARSQQD